MGIFINHLVREVVTLVLYGVMIAKGPPGATTERETHHDERMQLAFARLVMDF